MLFPIFLLAQDYVGKVTYYEGEVELIRSGKGSPIKYNQELYPSDLIKTGMNSTLEIEWVEKSKTIITSNSQYKIGELYKAGSKKIKEKTGGLFQGFLNIFKKEVKNKTHQEGGIRRNFDSTDTLITLSLAYDFFEIEDYTKAAESFEALIVLDDPVIEKDQILFALCYCYIQLNNIIKAEQILEQLKTEFSNSALIEDVEEILSKF